MWRKVDKERNIKQLLVRYQILRRMFARIQRPYNAVHQVVFAKGLQTIKRASQTGSHLLR